MIEILRDIAGWILIVGGGIFVIIGAVGLNRMPCTYSRMHATSVSDTFGAGMILLGLMIQAGFTLVTLKLAILLLFLWFTAPIATHALARAALLAGVRPVLAKDSPVSFEETAKGDPS